MEIKAKIKKPYTDTQRADFIVNNNYKLGYEIRELKDCIEAWGRTQEEQNNFEKEIKQKLVRQNRNFFLQDTDKFVCVPDFPIEEKTKDELIKYRQYLRDYTETENWFEQNPKTFEEFKK